MQKYFKMAVFSCLTIAKGLETNWGNIEQPLILAVFYCVHIFYRKKSSWYNFIFNPKKLQKYAKMFSGG